MAVISFQTIQAQERPGGRRKNPRERIAELEKVKLIETLRLDDEKMVKFFSKKDEFSQRVEKLNSQRNELLDQLEKYLSDGQDRNESDYRKMNQQLLDIEKNLGEAKLNYMRSLRSLLSEEQISKLILFERNFRREIRSLIFRERRSNSPHRRGPADGENAD